MTDGVFCANCGASITGEDNSNPTKRKPCPHCGSLARSFVLLASPGKFTLTGNDVDLIFYSYPEQLLTTAQGLIAKGEFSIAVVVAHIACEIGAQRAISRNFTEKKIEYLEESVGDLLPGYNLANERIRNLYNAVSGDQIQKQSFWQAFKDSATRRNRAVHDGTRLTKDEAEISYKAAVDLVAYFKQRNMLSPTKLFAQAVGSKTHR